jgi:hypothetical protein
MNYDVTYSLRKALETKLPEYNDVQMVYEGVKLSEIPKPFATIEYLQGGGELMAAGRTSYLDTYRFQVGIYARDINERHRLESKTRKILRDPDGHLIYLFDEDTETFVDSGEFKPFDVGIFTPIGNDDSSDSTNDFHGYFDVSIEIY